MLSHISEMRRSRTLLMQSSLLPQNNCPHNHPFFATCIFFCQSVKHALESTKIISIFKKSSKKRDLEKKKHMINQEFIAPSIFLSPSPAFSGLQGFLFLSLGHWGTRTCVLLSLCRMSQWSTCLLETAENVAN